MLTQRVPVFLGLILVCLFPASSPAPALAQSSAPTASVADLQQEIRLLRKRGDEFRRELKRQQQAVGKARQELQVLTARLDAQEVETSRLQDRTRVLGSWLAGLAVLGIASMLIRLFRRTGAEVAPPPLAVARERTGRIHEGLAALEARIQVIEQGSTHR